MAEVQVVSATPLGDQEVELITHLEKTPIQTIYLHDIHFWAGGSTYKITSFNYSVIYTTRGTLPDGVKYGISYADGKDTTARKWVVAFDTKAQKAYAEAGPIGPIDWNVVEVKLDQHSGNKSEYVDHILGGKCSAEINDLEAFAKFS